jgi:hypothetical protein
VSDELCHPFRVKPGCFLVHNGHWHEGAIAARLMDDGTQWSDTRCAARWIRLHGWGSFTRNCHDGVWLYMTPEGLFTHYATGDLYQCLDTGSLCSEPFKRFGLWDTVTRGTYEPDDKLPIAPPKQYLFPVTPFTRGV